MKSWQPLSSRKEFTRTLREGERAEGGILLLRVLLVAEGRRIGFSTKGGFKNAVCRNRAKRWMREALRVNLPLLPEGANAILVAKPGMQNSRFSDVLAEAARLLSELA